MPNTPRKQRRYAVLAPGCFTGRAAKTAHGVIAYGREPVVAVIDPALEGRRVCDVLPRLNLFEEAGLANHAPALLPPPSHPFAEQAWQKTGLNGAGSRQWDDTHWELDGLYLTSAFKKFCSWTPESAAWMRAKFAPGLNGQCAGKKVFYISRSGGPRSILNDKEIQQRHKFHDVTVV